MTQKKKQKKSVKASDTRSKAVKEGKELDPKLIEAFGALLEKLPDRHKLFALEYLKDFNGTQAAIRAGFSKKGARVTATRLLTNDAIRAFLKSQVKAREERLVLDADEILKELSSLARSNVQDFLDYDEDGIVSMKPLSELTRAEAACISEVTHQEDKDGRVSFKFKTHDKLKAIDLAGKHQAIKCFDEKIDLNLNLKGIKVTFVGEENDENGSDEKGG